MSNYLVYDLGGTFIKYALMNDHFNIIEQDKVHSPLDTLDDLIRTLVEIARPYQGRYEGIAMSMPGRINTDEGIAYTGGAYSFINYTNIAQLLGDQLHVKVVIGNDGKCAAKAEAAAGALKDVANGAVIVLGTGTGGGIVLNHHVWMGTSGGAGELSALVCDIHKLVKNGFSFSDFTSIYAGYGSAIGLISCYAEHKNIPAGEAISKIDGIAFFQAYDAGEQEAIDTLKEFGRNAAAGILSVQSVLDLEKYAIGGGISARKEVTDSIRDGVEYLYNGGFPLPYSKPEVVSCQYHNDANLIGALAFYLDRK